ncbi:MAG: PIG-L family deacetylase [Sulfurimonas sp.]|jgi:LmbE family N-acetylglucosaminyl deacetylase
MIKNILVLCPHTDDEIHCFGSLVKFKEQGAIIDIIAFSFPKDIPELQNEFIKSCKLLNANKFIYNFELRKLKQNRQEILEILVEFNKKEYDLILCPSSFDTHQDHEVINRECFRAFKYTTIWGYQVAHNCMEFKQGIFVILNKKQLDLKIEAIKCYQTQKNRMYFNNGFYQYMANMLGVQIKQQYAEVFENIRTIIK